MYHVYQPKTGQPQVSHQSGWSGDWRSPFTEAVKSPVEKLGSRILAIEQLEKSCGGAVNQSSGDVIMTEYWWRHHIFPGSSQDNSSILAELRWILFIANNCITEGKFLSTMGAGGSGPLQLNWPDGIEFNLAKNKIYTFPMTITESTSYMCLPDQNMSNRKQKIHNNNATQKNWKSNAEVHDDCGSIQGGRKYCSD